MVETPVDNALQDPTKSSALHFGPFLWDKYKGPKQKRKSKKKSKNKSGAKLGAKQRKIIKKAPNISQTAKNKTAEEIAFESMIAANQLRKKIFRENDLDTALKRDPHMTSNATELAQWGRTLIHDMAELMKDTPVLQKHATSDATRLLFLAGLEGTGHHAWQAMMHPCINTTACIVDHKLNLMLMDEAFKYVRGMFAANDYHLIVRDSKYVIDHMRELAASSNTTLRLIGLDATVHTGQLSYPSFNSDFKTLDRPDVLWLAMLAELAGLDLRVVVLQRDAGEILSSTTRRRFSLPKVLIDNAAALYQQLSMLHPDFLYCVNYTTMANMSLVDKQHLLDFIHPVQLAGMGETMFSKLVKPSYKHDAISTRIVNATLQAYAQHLNSIFRKIDGLCGASHRVHTQRLPEHKIKMKQLGLRGHQLEIMRREESRQLYSQRPNREQEQMTPATYRRLDMHTTHKPALHQHVTSSEGVANTAATTASHSTALHTLAAVHPRAAAAPELSEMITRNRASLRKREGYADVSMANKFKSLPEPSSVQSQLANISSVDTQQHIVNINVKKRNAKKQKKKNKPVLSPIEKALRSDRYMREHGDELADWGEQFLPHMLTRSAQSSTLEKTVQSTKARLLVVVGLAGSGQDYWQQVLGTCVTRGWCKPDLALDNLFLDRASRTAGGLFNVNNYHRILQDYRVLFEHMMKTTTLSQNSSTIIVLGIQNKFRLDTFSYPALPTVDSADSTRGFKPLDRPDVHTLALLAELARAGFADSGAAAEC